MNGEGREQGKQEGGGGEEDVDDPKPNDPRTHDRDHSTSSSVNEASRSASLEAGLTTEDVARAGGYGARDDIGSFLPVASDSTDFEASLRDARDFEEPQSEKRRPGLGWIDSEEKE